MQVEYSSYSTRKIFGPLWRWEADVKGERHEGYSFGSSSARHAARTAIRSRRDAPEAADA